MKRVLALTAVIAVLAALLIPSFIVFGENEMITFLSDMEWRNAEIYSADGKGAVPARDENLTGEELWLYDMYFEKGVCFHAMSGKNAFLEVDIEGKGYKTFYAYIGTAESEVCDVTMASVRFNFKADGKSVYRTELVTPRERPKAVTIDVTGVSVLRIEMDDGGDGISGDWGALGNALFSTSDSAQDIEAELEKRAEKPAETDGPVDPVKEIIEEKGGCGGTIGGLAAVTCACAASAVLTKKKKDH
ncbi:MAG: NPCBM/NEW2 domain-containing protein [Clostridia bacterium]|nr:NPCBM/NEW2 domain-containing protein [Clostridia bacterium]